MLFHHISFNRLLSLFSIGVLSTGSAITISAFAPASTAIAQSTTQPACPGDQTIAAATTTRIVEFSSLGTKVTIPENFRTLLYNNGTISILHPVDFNLIQCLTLGLPVYGTDAIRAERFRLVPNSEELSPQDYAASLTMPGYTLSESSKMQTRNGIQVVIREAFEQKGLGVGIAYAWYQVDDIDGIIEVSTTTKKDLLNVLDRVQLSNSAS
ncbi:MAG: hypothetical protein AAF716_19300 [Cyanobacteria bacterium P01_D01_bin.1]